MKTCDRVHFENIERGDRLHFHADDDFRDDWEGPRDFDVTVRDKISQSRHGLRILTEEKIGPDEHDDFYLVDGWEVTRAADVAPRRGTTLPVVTDEMAVVAWRAHHIEVWGDDLDPADRGGSDPSGLAAMRVALETALSPTGEGTKRS